MNVRQYDIVKIFLAMGNSVERIAKEFKADPVDVGLVAQSHNFERYQNMHSGYTGLFGGGIK